MSVELIFRILGAVLLVPITVHAGREVRRAYKSRSREMWFITARYLVAVIGCWGINLRFNNIGAPWTSYMAEFALSAILTLIVWQSGFGSATRKHLGVSIKRDKITADYMAPYRIERVRYYLTAVIGIIVIVTAITTHAVYGNSHVAWLGHDSNVTASDRDVYVAGAVFIQLVYYVIMRDMKTACVKLAQKPITR